MNKPIYRILAALVGQHARCVESNNAEWRSKSFERIVELVHEHFPSGSGFDNGTTLDVCASSSEKLVFETSFHHMNDHGYDGWTEHTVTVRGSLESGFDLRVGGRDRNEIKDYIGECFDMALRVEVEQYPVETGSE